ncbi:MAG: lipid-A-disaccharide synthase-related protein [Candidatus Sericytochromatia bacterium]
MNVLFVSNGEAEDMMALSLIRYWLYFNQEDRVAALAIAGSGKTYVANDIPLVAPPMTMPSNGFAYLSFKMLFQDFEAGLISHVKNQYKILKKLAPQIDYVVGVGDIVPVIAAWILDKPTAFVGCAMSDYYLDPKNPKASSYSSTKISMLKKTRALVFPRDELTTRNLQKLGVRAEYLGSPMMDCISYNKNLDLGLSKYSRVIGILPGSHDDRRENFKKIMDSVLRLNMKKPHTYLVAVSDKEDIPRYSKELSKGNWYIQKTEPKHYLLKNNKDEIHLLHGYFGNVLMSSHVVIGASGTGNEQAVGIGIPTISFPCGRIQYNRKFGESQKRLLGKALTYIPTAEPSIEALSKSIERAFNDNAYREEVKKIALERFGEFGASERIVKRILGEINPQYVPY